MTAIVRQSLVSIEDRYYTIYANCKACSTRWGYRDDDRNTSNYKDLQQEVDEHNKEVHSG